MNKGMRDIPKLSLVQKEEKKKYRRNDVLVVDGGQIHYLWELDIDVQLKETIRENLKDKTGPKKFIKLEDMVEVAHSIGLNDITLEALREIQECFSQYHHDMIHDPAPTSHFS